MSGSQNVGNVKPRRWTVDELTRLAFVHGEDDRRNMAECDNSDYGKEQRRLADAMRAYRIKRWGKTALEADMESAILTPVVTSKWQP